MQAHQIDVPEKAGMAEAGVMLGEPWAERLAALASRLQTLPDKPEESAETTLRTLWLLACGERLSPQLAMSRVLRVLSNAEAMALDRCIEQRLAGSPLAHLTERQHFMGLEMLAGGEALIPRAETELLARAGVAALRAVAAGMTRAPLVIDVCTGSGNVAAALAHAVPEARVHAADLSPEAVEFARCNMAHLGLQHRVKLYVGDLFSPFETDEFLGKVDVLTGNPPYISTGRLSSMPGEIVGHEPGLAFDGGPLGIRILQRIIREAPRYLRPGGWLAFEMGLGQGQAVIRRMSASGHFEQIEGLTDHNGEIRAVRARTRAAREDQE